MEEDYIEIRFGMIAVKKGFATPEQIVEALEIQLMENLNSGMHRRIGMILHDQGLITLSQIDEVLRSLKEQKFKN